MTRRLFGTDGVRGRANEDPMMAETATLRDLEVVDLPTGHWPMWSRPTELAAAIAAAARGPRPTGANGTLAR